jgi:hypothetical protein
MCRQRTVALAFVRCLPMRLKNEIRQPMNSQQNEILPYGYYLASHPSPSFNAASIMACHPAFIIGACVP